MVRRLTIVASMFLLTALVPGVAMAQPPGNDDLAAATSVNSIPFNDGVPTGEATTEPGEPTETCAPFANTVWYAVTLDTATDVFIDTAGSNYDTALAVWVGTSFDDLQSVVCVDDIFNSLQAAASFSAEAGVTYLVQVGAFGEAPPDAFLTVSIGEPPRDTGRPFVSRDSFRGSFAEAFIEEFDDETGTFSFQGVRVVDGRFHTTGTRPEKFATVSVDSFTETFDDETGTFTFTSWFGFADLDSRDFTIDRWLRSANVSSEVVLFGETCTETPDDFECVDLGTTVVEVDVAWTGVGPITRVRESSSEMFDGFRFRFKGSSMSRDATVSGGVTGDVGFDLTGAEGSLSIGAEGFWQWIRPLDQLATS